MSVISEEEAKDFKGQEAKNDYCQWCWGNDYGDCSKCALQPKQSEEPKA